MTDCERTHSDGHKTLDIEIHMLGKHHGLLDMPGTKKDHEMKFLFRVFDFKLYRGTQGYCPADDEVSFSIYTQGVWEAFETAVFIDILKGSHEEGLVVDIGANIGWYSNIARLLGNEVEAIECDLQILPLLRHNLGDPNISPVQITAATPTRSAEEDIAFFKVDIEGKEEQAFRVFEDYFIKQKVKYAMFEISPVFNDSYFELVPQIIKCGYVPFLVPHKGYEYMDEYENEPLLTLRKYCKIEVDDMREYVKSFSQENFIFIRNDLA